MLAVVELTELFIPTFRFVVFAVSLASRKRYVILLLLQFAPLVFILLLLVVFVVVLVVASVVVFILFGIFTVLIVLLFVQLPVFIMDGIVIDTFFDVLAFVVLAVTAVTFFIVEFVVKFAVLLFRVEIFFVVLVVDLNELYGLGIARKSAKGFKYLRPNSWAVRSANQLTPLEQDLEVFLLCSLMLFKFSSNTIARQLLISALPIWPPHWGLYSCTYWAQVILMSPANTIWSEYTWGDSRRVYAGISLLGGLSFGPQLPYMVEFSVAIVMFCGPGFGVVMILTVSFATKAMFL